MDLTNFDTQLFGAIRVGTATAARWPGTQVLVYCFGLQGVPFLHFHGGCLAPWCFSLTALLAFSVIHLHPDQQTYKH